MAFPIFFAQEEPWQGFSYDRFIGGKEFNQAIALSRAGTRVYLSGAIDTDSNFLLAFLGENQVDTSRVKVKPEYATGHTIIQKDTTGLKLAYAINCHARLAMIKTEPQDYSNASIMRRNQSDHSIQSPIVNPFGYQR
ncbi:PfkB family carbohydrate kinase [uncultured Sphaerochaeta sp.]|uniref:carbohydrate kinase family protein n=1 Tax=uncultured Sphaerochaeta sp. TaxID=886478 RepID=UPI002A0A3995|nr:PfkB family carbohydrate kinase [uncultured Sphaerochaeta sp.]